MAFVSLGLLLSPESALADPVAIDLTLLTNPAGTIDGGIGGGSAEGIFRINPDAPTGTGGYETFLQIGHLSHGTGEEGYNTSGKKRLNTGPSSIHNHDMQLLDFPLVTIGATDYIQLLADINEDQTDTDKYLSLDRFQIYTNPVAFTGNSTPTDPSLLGVLRYDIDSKGDGAVVLLNSELVSGGSGKGDIEVLIPTSVFTGLAATEFVYLYAGFGYQPDGAFSPPAPTGSEWAESDGFEEFGTTKDAPVYYGGGGFDFGDLPDSYDTTLAEEGPRHADGTFERLGKEWDAETDANSPLNATGDDVKGIDDEDGVMYVDGGVYVIPTVDDWDDEDRYNDDDDGAHHIFVDGWLDLNQDGDFWTDLNANNIYDEGVDEEDPGEHVVAYEANPNTEWGGANSPGPLFFAIPGWVPGFGPAGTGYYSRFRISYGTSTTWFGEAAFGEVEDYWVAPEPTTLAILGVGLVLAYRRRRRKQ